MKKKKPKRTQHKTLFETTTRDCDGGDEFELRLERAYSQRGLALGPPFLSFRLVAHPVGRGPKLEVAWFYGLRDDGDNLIALLAEVLGYELHGCAYRPNALISGHVQSGGTVCIYLGNSGPPHSMITLPKAVAEKLLVALAVEFGWDLTEEAA